MKKNVRCMLSVLFIAGLITSVSSCKKDDSCEAATTANAGEDQVVIGTSTTLAANTPTSGTGTWAIVSGDEGQIADPLSATSSFSGKIGNSYTLRWSITGCPVSEDEVQIDFTTNDPLLMTLNKSSVINGEIITVTGLNFSSNYNGGSQITTIKTDDPNLGQEVYLPILSRTATEIKAVVVGSNGGSPGAYDLRYNKKPDANAGTLFTSDLSMNITTTGANQFFTSSTFTATNISKGTEASFGVKNGSTDAADYTIKLVNYNYETGVMTEYSADITSITAGGYDGMDKIAFTVPADLPTESYYVKVTYNGTTLIGGWGYSLNVY